MDNDCLVVIYKITLSNQNYLTVKISKIDDVIGLPQTTFFHLTTDISII